jgi:hypothetical protein
MVQAHDLEDYASRVSALQPSRFRDDLYEYVRATPPYPPPELVTDCY